MSDTHPVNLTSAGPPNTALPAEEDTLRERMAGALGRATLTERRVAVSGIVADFPRSSAAWAALGELATDDVEAYAYFRVGYHRGLDQLRACGWRGSGYVRWSVETNRGFLRALRGLRDMARRIGELDEYERCELFIRQLEPSGVPDKG